MKQNQFTAGLRQEHDRVLEKFRKKTTTTPKIDIEPPRLILKAISNHTRRSLSVFDLHQKRYVFHHSAYNKHLNHPEINASAIENHQDPLKLTHPDDVIFSLKAEILIYSFLYTLPKEQYQQFCAVYIRRLKNKDNKYEVYKHRFFILLNNQAQQPWLILIETKRLAINLLAEFKPILSLTPACHNCTLPYVDTAINIHITKMETKILRLIVDGYRIKDLPNLLSISLHTVKNHYANIMRKTNTHSLAEVRIVAKILGM